jgi:hypothetical protein
MKTYRIQLTIEGQRFPYDTQAASRDQAILFVGMAFGIEHGEIYPGSKVSVKILD